MKPSDLVHQAALQIIRAYDQRDRAWGLQLISRMWDLELRLRTRERNRRAKDSSCWPSPDLRGGPTIAP